MHHFAHVSVEGQGLIPSSQSDADEMPLERVALMMECHFRKSICQINLLWTHRIFYVTQIMDTCSATE